MLKLKMKIIECNNLKLEILGIADKMASAASDMNAQNYDTLIESRSGLVSLCDKWAKEYESLVDVIDVVKTKFDEI